MHHAPRAPEQCLQMRADFTCASSLARPPPRCQGDLPSEDGPLIGQPDSGEGGWSVGQARAAGARTSSRTSTRLPRLKAGHRPPSSSDRPEEHLTARARRLKLWECDSGHATAQDQLSATLPARAPRVIKPLSGRSGRLFKRATAANRGGKVGRPSGGAAAGCRAGWVSKPSGPLVGDACRSATGTYVPGVERQVARCNTL